MISCFDLIKLQSLLKDFYKITQIRITVFDDAFHELASYPEQIAPFCQIIRSTEEGARRCKACDEAACRMQPLIPANYIASASHIMQAVGSFLCMERLVSLRQQKLPDRIDEYIQAHFTENIDAVSIAAHFQIGKTKIYKIAKENYGIGIAEYIRNLRIEKPDSCL